MEDICIYGFGTYGIQTYYFLKENGISVKCFADRNAEKQGYALDNINCIGYKDVLSLDKKSTILIVAVANPVKLIQEFKELCFIDVWDKEYAIGQFCYNISEETECIEPIHDIKILEELKMSLCDLIYQNIEGQFSNKDMKQIVDGYRKRRQRLIK